MKMITSPDYFLVLKDTGTLKRGQALEKMTILGQIFYGADRKNNFWTENFLRSKPDTYEHSRDRAANLN